tara:strand:- start:3 stop:608 length:606 start_codon:yes stop_codon:yes gene_type:complete
MTRQNISIGASANDGTGDTLRTAGTKINNTLREIYNKFGPDSVNLSSQISLEDSAVVFEGATADGFETRLMAENATADRLVRIPNASGTLVMDTLSQTITNKTIGEVSFQSADIVANGDCSDTATLIICNKGTALAVGLNNGTTVGEYKIFINKGAGTATVTPDNFAGGNSFALAQNEGATCVWDGTNWFLVGNQSVTTIA